MLCWLWHSCFDGTLMELFIETLGIWNWVIAGIILLLFELIIPGVYIMWFGCGALLTALTVFCVKWSAFALWETQIIVFLLFSIILVVIARIFFRRDKETDQPLLNLRTTQMVGHSTKLHEPIVNGQGHIRIDDTIWRVKGPDLPMGTIVKIVDFYDGAFKVEKGE